MSQVVKNFNLDKETIINDYYVAYLSRQASLIGRKEVLAGRAKFGIFGDGKELAQIALAKFFQKGDWRSGYYRDQSIMFALGEYRVEHFFAQLYADANIEREPHSGGRQMNCHFSSRYIKDAKWLIQKNLYNSSSDISPTAGQMSRLLGLAYASKLYRSVAELKSNIKSRDFSTNGEEVAFGTIGNASTSEGIFWETMNAACVLKVPLLMSIWDDDYGISVPNYYQTVKESISKALAGFSYENGTGLKIYTVKGYDYKELISVYQQASVVCRRDHTPCLVHVTHISQPQGHSTSGSHERYKSKTRLEYEKEIDCLSQMKSWLLQEKYATEKQIETLEKKAFSLVQEKKQQAWEKFQKDIYKDSQKLVKIIESLGEKKLLSDISKPKLQLKNQPIMLKKTIASISFDLLLKLQHVSFDNKQELVDFYNKEKEKNQVIYSNHLYNEINSPLQIESNSEEYDKTSKMVDGRQIIQQYFDKKLEQDPRVFIVGEDVGKLGGVNLEFEGLQEKHGVDRVSDTGIREASILGQGIGSAMRGLRPIVDIQYLDYLVYCLQTMTDDLATLHYRTSGGQTAPVIIRTKGHRLEGIWHTGSPMSMLLGATRGMHLCVPRNCTKAAGMYETLLKADDPAIVIEVLNGYRVKEKCPSNLSQYSVALGRPEIISQGSQLTLVTYGANVSIARQALYVLEKLDISVELIDVQTLIPFDVDGVILQSLQKTNAIIFIDEDVPGGATSYMLQKVIDEQGGYNFLDAKPVCLSAKEHRSAYGTDGDYFSKPNKEDMITACYGIMHERQPRKYPNLFA